MNKLMFTNKITNSIDNRNKNKNLKAMKIEYEVYREIPKIERVSNTKEIKTIYKCKCEEVEEYMLH